MSSVFLTGATGYIGGRLLRMLAQDERFTSIHCLVRNPQKVHFPASKKIHIVQGDLNDRTSLKKGMQNVSLVLHLAAYYELGIAKNQIANMETINIQGTENVLSLCKEFKIPKIIYVSTVYSLGNTKDKIVDETHEHCRKFTCHYERTKYEAHLIADQYIKDGLPLIVLNPGAVYGEHDPSIIGMTFKKILQGKFPGLIHGSEESKLTYVHVDDVVKGVLLAMDKGRVGQHYNLAGEVMTFADMLSVIAEMGQVKTPKRKIPLKIARFIAYFDEWFARMHGKKPLVSQEGINSLLASFAVSSEKAKAELGFDPRSNRDGFQQTTQWLKQNLI